MARIAAVAPEAAPPETRAVYDEITADWGTMLNDWQVLGESPQILLALHKLFFYLQGEKGGSITSVLDKELVAIRTSALNGCRYCLGHNVDLGQAVGLTLDQIQGAIGDFETSAALDARKKTLLRWTTAVTDRTAGTDDDALAALREHYTDGEIAELTLMCCLFNGWNRFTDAFKIELEAAADRDLTACLATTRPVASGKE